MRRMIFFRPKRHVPRYSNSLTIAIKSKDYEIFRTSVSLVYIYIYILHSTQILSLKIFVLF
jgi:hypothetical protein